MGTAKTRASATESAGVYNRRITIRERGSAVSDGQGGFTQPWQDVVSTWAYIEPLRGSESFTAQQIYPSMNVRMLIRYRPNTNISNAMQVLYGSHVFNIRSVTVIASARTVIELICEELQAKGSL